jgi:uncharacterized protein (TIGR02186 family)
MKRFGNQAMLLLLCVMALVGSAQAQEVLQVAIRPETVAIDAVYNGSELVVTGQLPENGDALVRIVGERGDLHLKKKGKIAGLLWMNLDTVTFRDLPSAFILYSAKDFSELLGIRPEASPARKLGLAYLQEQTIISPEPADKGALFQELLKLKEDEGLYGFHQEGLLYQKADANRQSFEARVWIPPRFPPGQYQVEVYALRNGEIIAHDIQPLTVKLVGLPAYLASFAFQHGALYGLFAVLVAVVAGLLTGFIFRGGKGGSH